MTVNQIALLNNSYRNMYVNQSQANKSLRNLSSGYRINRAADDAAGLAISEKMRGQISGLSQASRNAQDAISLVQTAEGGMNSATGVLQRMRELAVQASNGTYSDSDRALLDKEFQSLKDQLGTISTTSNYNGINLLDGTLGGSTGAQALTDLGINSITAGGTNTYTGDAKFSITQENGVYSITGQFGDETYSNQLAAADIDTTFTLSDGTTVTVDFGAVGNLEEGVLVGVGLDAGIPAANTSGARSGLISSEIQFQIGANGGADQRMGLHIGDMSSIGLNVWDLDISSSAGASSALKAIDGALSTINSERSRLGATQNRLEHSISNLNTTQLNLSASESTIRDADMAKEFMLYTQRMIQARASQAMLAQGMNMTRMNMMSMLMR